MFPHTGSPSLKKKGGEQVRKWSGGGNCGVSLGNMPHYHKIWKVKKNRILILSNL